MKAVVLGGSGLIGTACMRALRDAGFAVTGVARGVEGARRAMPWAAWHALDIARAAPADWEALLAGADVVVNAAGALQDGAGDDLKAIHEDAIRALIAAAEARPEGARPRIVQISAAGVAPDASTAFFRTKAAGDAALAASALSWTILRPALVLSPQAWGGTALLRAAAALPFAAPRMFPQARIRVLHVDDLAAAVVQAARGALPPRLTADLCEDGDQSFPALLTAMRRWLGLPGWRRALPVPAPLIALAGALGDVAGRFGWRSPLRSTALTVLAEGVGGDPGPWRAAGGAPCRSLAETLEALPSTRQERLFARLYLLMPLALVVLSLFWIASGLIGAWQAEAAMAVLSPGVMGPGPAAALVLGGAVADVALGALALWRRSSRAALWGMVALTAGYLLSGAVLTPELWADPLGPMLKPIPAAMLAALLAMGMGER